MVTELLNQQRIGVHSVFAFEDWLAENDGLLRRHPGAACTPVNEQELKKISSLTTPNRVLAVAELPDEGAHERSVAGAADLQPGRVSTVRPPHGQVPTAEDRRRGPLGGFILVRRQHGRECQECRAEGANCRLVSHGRHPQRTV